MKILFLGGVFDLSHQDEIILKTKTYVEYAANAFQIKLLNGLQVLNNDIEVISAPFLGAYPYAYEDCYFRGFQSSDDQSGFKYVHFFNIWGFRNLSRSKNLIKAVKPFAQDKSDGKIIIIYSPHTPLLEAACYAKKIDAKIRLCMIVPDLPQYMNLSANKSLLYRLAKKVDIQRFYQLNKKIDGYMILTEPMRDMLAISSKPYIVVEGIFDNSLMPHKEPAILKNPDQHRTIVYTGKLNESFGVMKLVKAFKQIQDNKISLVICGSGELTNEIADYAKSDTRIKLMGQVSMTEAKEYVNNASVLVNPRQNNDSYTMYSFPSKVIDYLSSGNPVVAYKLDGMPDIYSEFMYIVENNTIESLATAIKAALYDSDENKRAKTRRAHDYLLNQRTPNYVAELIIEMFV